MDDSQNRSSNENRLLSADVIRVIAIFLVILGPHYAGPLLYKWNDIPRTHWIIANIYDCFSIVCIPLFVILSGSLLLQKQEGYISFFKKRFTKLIIPFIAWIVIYILWRILYHHEDLSTRGWLGQVTGGTVYYHLWFLYMIIGLYAITPLLRKFVKNVNRLDQMYFLFLWISYFSIVPSLAEITRQYLNVNIPEPFGGLGEGYIWIIAAFIGYYVLGSFIIAKQYSKKKMTFFWCSMIIGSILTAVVAYVLSLKADRSVLSTYAYCSPTVIITSISAFILLTHYLKVKDNSIHPKIKTAFSQLSQATLGIYLVHPLFLELLSDGNLGFVLSATTFNPLLAIPISATVTFAISAISILIIMRIPILKYIV